MSHTSLLNSEQKELLSSAQGFVPLLSLRTSYLEYLLLNHCIVEYVCSGQIILARGTCDYRHIYLLNGTIALSFASGYRELVEAGATINPIINEMPRPCDVITETDCTFLIVDSERLDRILSWSQISQYLLTELSVRRDFDEDIEWIQTVLNSNLFFKVPPVNAERILGRMQVQCVDQGEVIVRQGEIGDCCYFIKSGEARVTRHDDQEGSIHLADIGLGRCFGEDALVFETVRNATVQMLTSGVLMRLDKRDFDLLLVEPKVEEIDENDSQRFVEVSPVYIDVRTLDEYAQGHLSMATNMPLSLLAIEKRLLHKDIPYILYCDTGRRSRSAAYLLAKQGFQAASLRGGLLGAGIQYQLVSDSSYILKDGRVVKADNQ